MPEVSIIMPLYNCESFISETIDSILGQTYKDFEIITIDDGSTDDTYKLVTTKYGEWVKCVQQKNSGLSCARNTGLSLARGRYIAFIDHDDKWLPNKLETQLSIFKDKPDVGLVFSDAYIVDKYGRRINNFFKITRPYRGMVFKKLLKENFIPILTVAVKRDIFNKIGFFSSRYKIAEDWDMFLRISQQYPVDYIDSRLAEYRIHSLSFSKNRELVFQECLDVLGRYLKATDNSTRKILKKSISVHKSGLGSIYLKTKENSQARKYFLESIKDYPINLKSYIGLASSFSPIFLSNLLIGLITTKDIHE